MGTNKDKTGDLEGIYDIVKKNGMSNMYKSKKSEYSLEDIMKEVKGGALKEEASEQKDNEKEFPAALCDAEIKEVGLGREEETAEHDKKEASDALKDAEIETEHNSLENDYILGENLKEEFSKKLDELFEEEDLENEDEDSKKERAKRAGFLSRFKREREEGGDSKEDDAEAFLEEKESAGAPDDYGEMLKELLGEKKLLKIRFFGAATASMILLIMFFLPSLGMETGNGIIYAQAGILFMAMCFCYVEMGTGLLSLFTFQPQPYSLAPFAAAVVFVYSILEAGKETFVSFLFVASVSLTLVVLAKLFKNLHNLSQIKGLKDCDIRQKICLETEPEYALGAKEFYKDGSYDEESILIARKENSEKTFGSKDAFKAEDEMQRVSKISVSITFILILIAAGAVIYLSKEPSRLLYVIMVLSLLSTPLMTMFAVVLPWSRAQKESTGGIIISADEGAKLDKCNGIVLTDKELFPAGSIVLKSMKILGEYEIEGILQRTANLCKKGELALSDVFDKILWGKMKSFSVEEFSVVSGRGISGRIDGKEIKIGSRRFMEDTLKDIPEDNRKALKGGKGLISDIYVAEDGVVTCIFSVIYQMGGQTRATVTSLYKRGINIFFKSNDPLLSEKKMEDMLSFPSSSIYPLDGSNAEMKEEGSGAQSGVYILKKGLIPFADTLLACKKISSSQFRNIVLNLVSVGLGFLLFLPVMCLGAFEQAGTITVSLYLAVCSIPVILNSKL